jgi:hypothetical protein
VKKVISLAVFVILPSLLLYTLDLITGYLYDHLAPEWGKKHLSFTMEDSLKKATHNNSKITYKPYLLYSNTPNFSSSGTQQHNNNGYRNSYDVNVDKNNDEYRILCLGGSTTYGAGVSKPEHAWPELLLKLLKEEKSKIKRNKITVLNAGLEWATSAELLTHFLFKHIHFKPDLVIIHSGGNDMAPLMQNNFELDYSHWRNMSSTASSTLRPGEYKFIELSNIVRFGYSVWFNSFGYTKNSLSVTSKIFENLNIENIRKNINYNPPSAYKSNIFNLITSIQESGSDVIFFQFFRPSYKKLQKHNIEAFTQATQKLQVGGNFLLSLDPDFQFAVDKLKSSIKEICTNKNTEFVEINDESMPYEYFTDQCHLNLHGQLIKAEFLFSKVFRH